MKKLLVIFLALAMTVTFASSSLASVYLDYFNGDYWEHGSDNAKGWGIGADWLINDCFKLGIDYLGGDENYYNENFSFIDLKAGYVFSFDNSALELFIAYDIADFYSAFEGKAVMIGLDYTYNFSDAFLVEASIKGSVSSDKNFAWIDDYKILNYKINFNYYFAENFGVKLGYNRTNISADGWTDCGFKGVTLGMTYKF
jgi:predicted porin